MAVSVKNIEKFLSDHHYEISDLRQKQIREAAQKASENGIIVGGTVEKIMKSLTQQFFREVNSNFDHMKIALEALKKL